MTNPSQQPSAPAEGHGLEELIATKKAKIAELRGRGIDPYPIRTTRQHDCAKVSALAADLTEPSAHSAEKVSIAGRLVELRDMGKSIFGRLSDHTGRAQVYFKKDTLGEDQFSLIKKDIHVKEVRSKVDIGLAILAITFLVIL
jgi:lysyl-tRNA synthetase class 2